MGMDKSTFQKVESTLIGFNGKESRVMGTIMLPITVGVMLRTTLIVLDKPSTYNAILGRSWMH